ncbi:hypothetical protein GCM10023238_33520 [Streptomyces heliomycini]
MTHRGGSPGRLGHRVKPPARSSADWRDCSYPALVYVAPDTASISASPAATAAWLSFGTASEVIRRSAARGRLHRSAAVILRR